MSLSHLSNKQLVERIKELTQREKNITSSVISHLAEIERRRLYLEMGYGSLFDYATRALQYSKSAAGRRIKAARCIAKIPEVGVLLENHSITLSSLLVIAECLTLENKELLLAKVKGKSREEVERILAKHQPASRKELRDTIRPVVVARQIESKQLSLESLNVEKESKALRVHSGSNYKNSGESHDDVQLHRIAFSAEEKFLNKLQRAKELLRGKRRKGVNLEDVLDAALDEFLLRNCPKTRREKRCLSAMDINVATVVLMVCGVPSVHFLKLTIFNLLERAVRMRLGI